MKTLYLGYGRVPENSKIGDLFYVIGVKDNTSSDLKLLKKNFEIVKRFKEVVNPRYCSSKKEENVVYLKNHTLQPAIIKRIA